MTDQAPTTPGQPNYIYAPQPPRNGLGIAGLICGIVGILFGSVFIGFWIAGPLGVAGLVLSFAGRDRVRRNEATNGRATTAGIWTSVAALALSVWGAVEIFGTR